MGARLEHIQGAEVTAILLCPSQATGAPVTLEPPNPQFRPLLAALAIADEKATHGNCLMYGDIPQTVEVKLQSEAALVLIPVDKCGHYNERVKTELNRARSG
jgi:hypothetical protein